MSEDNGMREDLDLVVGTDEDGNEVTLQVMDYFFYNGEEYAILADYEAQQDDDAEDVDCFVMKVVTAEEDGEEYDDFLPIEDEALEEKLIRVANARMNEDDEDDEEDE